MIQSTQNHRRQFTFMFAKCCECVSVFSLYFRSFWKIKFARVLLPDFHVNTGKCVHIPNHNHIVLGFALFAWVCSNLETNLQFKCLQMYGLHCPNVHFVPSGSIFSMHDKRIPTNKYFLRFAIWNFRPHLACVLVDRGCSYVWTQYVVACYACKMSFKFNVHWLPLAPPFRSTFISICRMNSMICRNNYNIDFITLKAASDINLWLNCTRTHTHTISSGSKIREWNFISDFEQRFASMATQFFDDLGEILTNLCMEPFVNVIRNYAYKCVYLKIIYIRTKWILLLAIISSNENEFPSFAITKKNVSNSEVCFNGRKKEWRSSWHFIGQKRSTILSISLYERIP